MANFSVSSIERGLAILELLVDHDEGLQISAIAQRLALPLSATHRLLQALVNAHYVRQEALSERYVPTLKLGAMGLRLFSGTSVTEVAQPILDDLARQTGELVRLAVVEDSEMIWVAKAQGATGAIRCDPISGHHVPLHTTGMGKAWLASMAEDEAIARVEARGLRLRAFWAPTPFARWPSFGRKFARRANWALPSMIRNPSWACRPLRC